MTVQSRYTVECIYVTSLLQNFVRYKQVKRAYRCKIGSDASKNSDPLTFQSKNG